MATWTDKDVFHLMHYTHNTYYHSVRLAVSNDLRQYSSTGDVLPVRTNGEVITAWWSHECVKAQPINRAELAALIRNSKPNDDLPVLVVAIPEIERVDIGAITYCWAQLNTASTMQLWYTGQALKGSRSFEIPKADKDLVSGFERDNPLVRNGTPRIYYDWREALTPIANYFKAVIKYCKDTGKARRLADEAVARALNDRNGIIRTLVAKNDKRFKDITF